MVGGKYLGGTHLTPFPIKVKFLLFSSNENHTELWEKNLEDPLREREKEVYFPLPWK